jgi:UDP-glucose 4-epimerase
VDFSLFGDLAPFHQPQSDLAGTIDRLREGLQSIQFNDNDFRNSSFMRLRVLSGLVSLGLLNATLEWTYRRSPLPEMPVGNSETASLPH